NLIAYIAAHQAEMLAFLKKLVLVQSGSHNKPGVDRVRRLIAETIKPLGLEMTTNTQKSYGDILIASTPSAGDRDNILLIGHMDTVFPEDTSFNWWLEDEKNAYGPGVIDMKGGLVVGIYALKALAASGLLDEIPLRFIFNSEEEIGSPVSGPVIAFEAKRSAMAFVLECGGLDGQVVTGRKGRIGLKLEICGQAGHAAFAGKDKASAILELAHKTIELEKLNSCIPGLTVNVGRIQGGIGPNSIAESALAMIDVRFSSQKGADFFQAKLDEIVSQPVVPGTVSKYEVTGSRPPMEQTAGNQDLFRVVEEQARKLEVPVVEEYRMGASDASIVAAKKTPVIDGLGPIGDLDHSDREYIVKNSIVQRCQLLALSIIKCRRLNKEDRLFLRTTRKE
ncbi:MAG: M20 family metallopeptidase, partial [Chloroflexota bacterium]|nr:M20 family metallopeptidase [Chloroflexota bacterium]